MPDTLTVSQIQAELTEVRAAITRITKRPFATEDLGPKTVVYEGSNKLTALYERERELERKLARLERGGIRVRSGVLR